ncbi:MAG TPA: cytochrome c, partial [Gemmatimonadaceae bacterium]|nr:cytochrome c [Gemmatimonadaceae bacterium]
MSRLLSRLVVPAAAVASIVVFGAVAGSQGAPPPRTSADSSFTEAQAERGGQVFTRVCLECHERSEMANPDFRLKWGGQSTFDLFKSISTTMPDSDPGSLPRNDYADVVAYILKLNGIPAGTTELAADSVQMSAAKISPRETASLGLRRPGATPPSRPGVRRIGLAFVHGR